MWLKYSSEAMKKCMGSERWILKHCTGLSYNWKTKKCGWNAELYRWAIVKPLRELVLNLMESFFEKMGLSKS